MHGAKVTLDPTRSHQYHVIYNPDRFVTATNWMMTRPERDVLRTDYKHQEIKMDWGGLTLTGEALVWKGSALGPRELLGHLLASALVYKD